MLGQGRIGVRIASLIAYLRTCLRLPIRRIQACGKPAGILTPDRNFAERCIALGTVFTAVAVDVGLIARESETIARHFKSS